MVERGGLENRCPLGDRGFESLTLCKTKAWHKVPGFFKFWKRCKLAYISEQNLKKHDPASGGKGFCIELPPKGIASIAQSGREAIPGIIFSKSEKNNRDLHSNSGFCLKFPLKRDRFDRAKRERSNPWNNIFKIGEK